ncbi:MAG: 4-hydroxythreonine-4-phosphate dehydrogenase PdxA [Robiginitomaculum sp.]
MNQSLLPIAPPLVVTLGDPAGIGLEITAKAWDYYRNSPESAFFVLGCIQSARRASLSLDLPQPIAISSPSEAADIFPRALPVLPIGTCDAVLGRPSVDAAGLVIKSIETATQMALGGQASAMVTNPIAKSVLYQAGFTHAGHTEFLGALTEGKTGPGGYAPQPRGPVMMLSGGGLRVALATIHMALSAVPSALTTQRIIHVGQVMTQALKRDFGIDKPRIALTGLNPHAGEDSAMGDEEARIINPAARALRAMGIDITDAQPADTLFHAEARNGYDAALAMYHDQGLIPVKTLDFHGGVNITLGLPIIRTSPDHGTAFAIAGKGLARPDSLIAAIKTARDMGAHRKLTS